MSRATSLREVRTTRQKTASTTNRRGADHIAVGTTMPATITDDDLTSHRQYVTDLIRTDGGADWRVNVERVTQVLAVSCRDKSGVADGLTARVCVCVCVCVSPSALTDVMPPHLISCRPLPRAECCCCCCCSARAVAQCCLEIIEALNENR